MGIFVKPKYTNQKFAEFLNENINEDEIDAFLRDNAT